MTQTGHQDIFYRQLGHQPGSWTAAGAGPLLRRPPGASSPCPCPAPSPRWCVGTAAGPWPLHTALWPGDPLSDTCSCPAHLPQGVKHRLSNPEAFCEPVWPSSIRPVRRTLLLSLIPLWYSCPFERCGLWTLSCLVVLGW